MAENRGEFNEINITPLTDIFLVLLIIMMVIAPMLDQQGLNLTVPENVAEQVHDKDVKILTVRISPQDRFYVDEQEVSAEQLQIAIAGKIKEYPDGVLIQSDDNATHGAIVKVMDSARNAGVTGISLEQI